MISIHKLSINFTGDFLFKDISFVVGDRDRGKNVWEETISAFGIARKKSTI